MTCESCAFNPIVQAIKEFLRVYVPSVNGHNVRMNPIENLVYRTTKKNKKVCEAAKKLLPAFNKLTEYLENDMLPLCQGICDACSKSSNDDNLSHDGQTFVSIDAITEASEIRSDVSVDDGRENGLDDETGGNEGEGQERDFDAAFFEDDESDANDGIEAGGDWVHRNTIPRSSESSGGVTKLPLHIEDELGRVFREFKQLSMLEQIVILARFQEMSFADIGSMRWVPHELKRHNDKQLVTFWWKRIIDKFPYVEGLSKAKAGKREPAAKGRERAKEGADYKSHYPKDHFEEQKFDFGPVL